MRIGYRPEPRFLRRFQVFFIDTQVIQAGSGTRVEGVDAGNKAECVRRGKRAIDYKFWL